MLVFELAQKSAPATVPVSNQEIAQAIAAFKKAGGYREILKVPKEKMMSILQSEYLWHALRFPDALPADEQKNFLENMKMLGKKGFGDLVLEAYGMEGSGPLRLLFNDLYHSQVGKTAAESLGFLYGLRLTKKGMGLSDSELRSDFAYSKYNEEIIRVDDLSKPQKEAYGKLEDYLLRGDDAAKKAFFDYIGKQPEAAIMIGRTQDVREAFDKANQTKDGAARMRELFTSSEFKPMFEGTLDYAEGINTVGILWNTKPGRDFLFSGLLRSPISFTKTALMIMDKQGKFDEPFKADRQVNYKAQFEQELASGKWDDAGSKKAAAAQSDAFLVKKPLKEVPTLLHKKEFDAIVRPKLDALKAKFQGNTSNADFEKLAIDGFERFYYDATRDRKGGAKVVESKTLSAARETIRNEYLSLSEERRADYLLEGTTAYLELGIAAARKKIAKSGQTGFL